MLHKEQLTPRRSSTARVWRPVVRPSSPQARDDGDPAARVALRGRRQTELCQVLSICWPTASKYTPDGGRIWLTVAREGSQAVIRVRDDGLGIPADMMPLIFKCSRRSTAMLDHATGRIGDRLDAGAKAVDAARRDDRGHSDGPGKGSDFTVPAPCRWRSRRRRVPPALRRRKPGERRTTGFALPHSGGGRQSRLGGIAGGVAGDDQRLESEQALDGPQAMEIAAQFQPQLVLLDIGLPGISGYDVARRMRQMPNSRTSCWSPRPAGGRRKTSGDPRKPASTLIWSSRSVPSRSRNCWTIRISRDGRYSPSVPKPRSNSGVGDAIET